MATIFCNAIALRPGQERLSEFLLSQHEIVRTYHTAPTSYVIKSSPGVHRFSRPFLNKTPTRGLEVQWQRQRQCRWSSSLSEEAHSRSTYEEAEEEKGDISRATLIWRAIKLPIYSVALVPLTVGTAAAYLQTGLYSAWRYFVPLASSVLVISWLNLSNDVYDFDTGADKTKKESVVNIVGSRTGTLVAAWLLLALGFMGLTWVSVESGNMRSILLLACAIVCGYIYQEEDSFHFLESGFVAVPTISIWIPRTWGTSLLCSIWAFCYHSLLLIAERDK